MNAPEAITIIFNAADAQDRYEDLGLQCPRPREDVDRDDLLNVIDFHKDRLFRLGGRTLKNTVILRVTEVDTFDAILHVENTIEPPFEASYRLAEQPPVRVQEPHCDLEFRLELV